MPSGSEPVCFSAWLAMNLSITAASPDCAPEVDKARHRPTTMIGRRSQANVLINLSFAVQKMIERFDQMTMLFESRFRLLSGTVKNVANSIDQAYNAADIAFSVLDITRKEFPRDLQIPKTSTATFPGFVFVYAGKPASRLGAALTESRALLNQHRTLPNGRKAI